MSLLISPPGSSRQSSLYRNDAFLSLYHTFRAGQTPYFYYVGAEFSALFIGKGKGTESVRAVVSRTTKGFRDKLQAEGET